jgi:hypothetical protein
MSAIVRSSTRISTRRIGRSDAPRGRERLRPCSYQGALLPYRLIEQEWRLPAGAAVHTQVAERLGLVDSCQSTAVTRTQFPTFNPLEPVPESGRSLEGARTVFLMHLLDGFDYGEIGRRLGITVGDVERRFAAAMYHMSCELDGSDERDGEPPE